MKKLMIIGLFFLIATLPAFSADMHKCCIESAEAGRECCGKDAETVKANYDSYKLDLAAEATAKESLHKCCAKSLGEGKGCCDLNAEELQAKYDSAVNDAKAEALMSKRCEKTKNEGKSCCGSGAK